MLRDMGQITERRRTIPGSVLAAVLACACLLACTLPARAVASATMQTSLMDDNLLIYATPDQVSNEMTQLRSMGIDELKVSVVWSLIAPNAKSQTQPSFDATDPSAYPAHVWDRYDLIDRLAAQLGLKVYFQVVPPAPAWAVATTKPVQGYGWSQKPNPFDYQQFAQAIGTRYSGSFSTTVPTNEPPPPTLLGIPLGSLFGSPPTPGQSSPLPRVDVWGLWNEPNEGAWLNPQSTVINHHRVDVASSMYRQLVDGGYRGLIASGHTGDTILVGETASSGTTTDTTFVRNLYCVGNNNLPLRGATAAGLDCPQSGSASAFVSAHPGLFFGRGFAQHPYSFDRPPTTPLPIRGAVTMATMHGFERTFDQIFQAYGRAGGIPIYITEYGYKTNPPNPFVKTSLTQQATWLNQAEYMAWEDPRIVSMNQFLLSDDMPRAGANPGTLSYWSTFQTGLEYSNGTHKPSYRAFEIPIWLPSARRGPNVTVWGQLRAANHTTTQTALLQFQPRGSTRWSTIQTVHTTSAEGFLVTHVALTGSGAVRLAWTDPSSGTVDYSRTVDVH
jgi:hypothetical protein